MVESNGEFCLPAAGADALNTAARDDPDRMRQTDRQFARQGGTLQKAEDKYIWTPPHAWVSGGPSLQYTGLWLACQMQHSINSAADEAPQFDTHSQPMRRFTCLIKYEPGLIH